MFGEGPPSDVTLGPPSDVITAASAPSDVIMAASASTNSYAGIQSYHMVGASASAYSSTQVGLGIIFRAPKQVWELFFEHPGRFGNDFSSTQVGLGMIFRAPRQV